MNRVSNVIIRLLNRIDDVTIIVFISLIFGVIQVFIAFLIASYVTGLILTIMYALITMVIAIYVSVNLISQIKRIKTNY